MGALVVFAIVYGALFAYVASPPLFRYGDDARLVVLSQRAVAIAGHMRRVAWARGSSLARKLSELWRWRVWRSGGDLCARLDLGPCPDLGVNTRSFSGLTALTLIAWRDARGGLHATLSSDWREIAFRRAAYAGWPAAWLTPHDLPHTLSGA